MRQSRLERAVLESECRGRARSRRRVGKHRCRLERQVPESVCRDRASSGRRVGVRQCRLKREVSESLWEVGAAPQIFVRIRVLEVFGVLPYFGQIGVFLDWDWAIFELAGAVWVLETLNIALEYLSSSRTLTRAFKCRGLCRCKY